MHWKEDFLQLLYFWKFVSRFFLDRVKKVENTSVFMSFLWISKRDDQMDTIYEK